MNLIVVNADEDDSILSQELSGQKEAWVHHREPAGMVAAARLGIARHRIAFGVLLAGELKVGGQGIGVIVNVDAFLAGIVGRIYVDHLDPAKIGLIEELENLKVLSLDEDVLRQVEIDRLLSRHGTRVALVGVCRSRMASRLPAQVKE